MHRAWQIEEIRYQILRNLTTESLARLAQTCHACFDSTVDELWKTIGSVEPLLACLPLDHRLRPLQEKDLTRLTFYGSRIQCISLTSSDPVEKPLAIPPQYARRRRHNSRRGKSWQVVWSEIVELSKPFLPNLRCLRVNGVSERLLIPFEGISGSNLTHVYIGYVHGRQQGLENIVSRVLAQIQDTSKLEYLLIRDYEPAVVSSETLRSSPLVHLQLGPRGRLLQFENPFAEECPLQPEILQLTRLQHLTVGLSQFWYSPAFKNLNVKYLALLKELWLDLAVFLSGSPPSDWHRQCLIKSDFGWTCGDESFANPDRGHDSRCWKRSPALFLQGLDKSKLEILNIRFNYATTASMLEEVVTAAKHDCRLQNLSMLGLIGARESKKYRGRYDNGRPLIYARDLRKCVQMLLPLPRLKSLKLTVCPDFLDGLDLSSYETFTSGMPMLEKLWLGYPRFTRTLPWHGVYSWEKLPLHHVAAFCSMLPNLVEVSVGTIYCHEPDDTHIEWICPGIESFAVAQWAKNSTEWGWSQPNEDLVEKVRSCVKLYFPSSKEAEWNLDSKLWGSYVYWET